MMRPFPKTLYSSLYILFLLFTISGCSGAMTLIPRSGGQPINANYGDSMGNTKITFQLPSGETLQGKLIWIPPGGTISTALISTNQGVVTGTGMSTGNKGMYIGAIAGDRGTTMRIELLCNAFTGGCAGVGQTSDGTLYDIIR